MLSVLTITPTTSLLSEVALKSKDILVLSSVKIERKANGKLDAKYFSCYLQFDCLTAGCAKSTWNSCSQKSINRAYIIPALCLALEGTFRPPFIEIFFVYSLYVFKLFSQGHVLVGEVFFPLPLAFIYFIG